MQIEFDAADRAEETRTISELRPHEMNERIYGAPDPDPDLIESIQQLGVVSPIVITEDGRIVAGHRRWASAKDAGLDQVPVVVRPFEDELEIEQAVVESNRQREKDNEQKAREVRELKRIAQTRAQARRAATLKQNQGTQIVTDPENLPDRESGDSRDIAAEHTGWSGRTAERAIAVVNTIDEAVSKGDAARADELRAALDRSVNKAHRLVVGQPTARNNKKGRLAALEDDYSLDGQERETMDRWKREFGAASPCLQEAWYQWISTTYARTPSSAPGSKRNKGKRARTRAQGRRGRSKRSCKRPTANRSSENGTTNASSVEEAEQTDCGPETGGSD